MSSSWSAGSSRTTARARPAPPAGPRPAPPAGPGSSAPGRRSPRWPTSCAPAHARAPEVAAQGVPATAVSAHDPAVRAGELTEAAVGGDRRALARLLTAVENRTPVAEAALRTLYPMAGRAHLVGITGPPGAGKSTLVAAPIAELRAPRRAVGGVG